MDGVIECILYIWHNKCRIDYEKVPFIAENLIFSLSYSNIKNGPVTPRFIPPVTLANDKDIEWRAASLCTKKKSKKKKDSQWNYLAMRMHPLFSLKELSFVCDREALSFSAGAALRF